MADQPRRGDSLPRRGYGSLRSRGPQSRVGSFRGCSYSLSSGGQRLAGRNPFPRLRGRSNSSICMRLVSGMTAHLQSLALERDPEMGPHSIGLLYKSIYNGDLEATTQMISERDYLCDVCFVDGRRPLMLAVERQHYEIAAFLLEHGADPCSVCKASVLLPHVYKHSLNASAEYAVTALNIALCSGNVPMMRLLLSHGATPSRDCSFTWSDIAMFAVESRHVDLLVDIMHCYDKDARRYSCEPLLDMRHHLHVAVCRAFPEMVQNLILLGVSPDDEFSFTTPLLTAADKGDMDMCRVLIKAGAHLGRPPGLSRGNPPLILAILRDIRQGFQNLIKLGCDVNVEYRLVDSHYDLGHGFHLRKKCPALHCAVFKRNRGFVEELVKAGADLSATDDEGNTALHLACFDDGETEILEKLLMLLKGVPGQTNLLRCVISACNLDGKTPLMIAASNGMYEYIPILLEYGADVNARAGGLSLGKGVLHFALESHSEDTVLYLLRNGCDVNMPFEGQWRPMHHAIAMDRVNYAEILLDFGADINLVTDSGESCLHTAVRNGSLDLVELMVDNGLQVNQATSSGETPLMMTSQHLSPDICSYLIEKGAILDARDSERATALKRSLYHKKEDPARALIMEGADLNLGSIREITPIYWCYTEGLLRTLHLLVVAGVHFTPSHLGFDPRASSAVQDKELMDWLISKVEQPRCLRELCRFSLRNCLVRQASSTGIGRMVRALPLPAKLQDYIMFKPEVEQYFPEAEEEYSDSDSADS